MSRGIAVFTAALLIGAGTSPATAANDREDDRAGHARLATVDVQVAGKGFGHGIGLSQYGAYGRAKAGDTWKQILAFYYPGTKLGSAGGKIRVWLEGDTTDDVKVRSRSGLTAQSLGSGKTWKLPKTLDGRKVSQWRITPDGSRSQIDANTNSWHSWKNVPGEAQFDADGAPIKLVTPDGAHAYRGALRSAGSGSSGGRDTVNVLPLESYVRGVVSAEMPSYWDDDAVASQAVAARTYAAFERADAGSRYYDLCDTAHCQVYKGVSAEWYDTDDDIRRTAGRIVTYHRKPAFTQFSASNGGYSVQGSEPYLVSKRDRKDKYTWTATIDASRLGDSTTGTVQGLEVTSRDSTGRVKTVTVDGTLGDRDVDIVEFQDVYGLQSTLFTLG